VGCRQNRAVRVDKTLVRRAPLGAPDGGRLPARGTYAEVGSGKKGADCPKWEELLRSLRGGDALMVTVLSRLGRSTSPLSALTDDLRERGVALRILNLGVDTGTPADPI